MQYAGGLLLVQDRLLDRLQRLWLANLGGE